jgi:hypothetical protein
MLYQLSYLATWQNIMIVGCLKCYSSQINEFLISVTEDFSECLYQSCKKIEENYIKVRTIQQKSMSSWKIEKKDFPPSVSVFPKGIVP